VHEVHAIWQDDGAASGHLVVEGEGAWDTGAMDLEHSATLLRWGAGGQEP